jgi:hypothetical protein
MEGVTTIVLKNEHEEAWLYHDEAPPYQLNW